MMYKDIIEFLESINTFGTGVTVTLVIILCLIRNPLLIFKFFSSVLVFINRTFGFFKKATIKSQIETQINEGIQALSIEAPTAFNKSLKVEWISNGEDHASLKDGTVIVRIKHDQNLVKPIVDATLLYLKNGVIADSRPFIERKLLTAIDLVLAYRILVHSPHRDSINYLNENYIEHAVNDLNISEYYEKADRTDQAGILTRIILREFSGFSAKLAGKRPNRVLRIESINFFDFVSRFVDRRIDIPLRFFGPNFRCTIALIARPEVVERSGLVVYQRNFRRDIDQGVHVIYLLSKGTMNVQVGRHIAKWANDEGLISGSIPDRFMLPNPSGDMSTSECIVCFSSKIGRSIQISPYEEVQIAISHIIPESLTGEIDIISIAREPGKLTKILIDSDIHADPIRICKGDNDERLQLISQELGETEIIDFIKVKPNIKDTVISALTPLDPSDVEIAQVSPEGNEIRIVIKDSAAARRAVGKDGVNLQIAEKLTNIHIQLSTREDAISPEEQVKDILSYLVPQIKSNEIRILRIARRVGRATKILVDSDKIHDLKTIFYTTGRFVSDDVSADLGGEYVHIIIWDPDDLQKVISESLYPLKRNEINSIEVDKDKKKAVVTLLNQKSFGYAVGRDGDNVQLAEQICGMKLEIK